MLLCKYCDLQFESTNKKVFANHVKWCDKNPNSSGQKVICKYCSKLRSKISILRHEATCISNPVNFRYCLNCKTPLTTKQQFCSSSCAAISSNAKRLENDNQGYRKKGFEFKEILVRCDTCNVEFTTKEHVPKNHCFSCREVYCRQKKEKITYCCVCQKLFISLTRDKPRLTCSDTCFRLLLSKNNKSNPNCGGETNYRKYRYKDIWMDSSWEVELAKFLDSHNITWLRSRKIVFDWIDSHQNNRRYYPDFYLPQYNLYLDPKNKYLFEKDKEKIAAVKAKHGINLLVGDLDTIKAELTSLVAA